MSPAWLFYVYIDGVVRDANAMVIWKGLELLHSNCDRFEINLLLFTDATALVADSDGKLCKLVSVFGRVWERRKLRVNICMSKVMRCSRYGNCGRLHVILDSELLNEVDCLSTWGRKWQLIEDVKEMWYAHERVL